MNHEIRKQIKQDCKGFMRMVIGMSFFHRVTNVVAPMIVAWMIGDMADYLLALDKNTIVKGMIPFLCAVFFRVVIASIFQLTLNLFLTKQGFAYDGFLMEKFIRLPLQTIEKTDAGAVMERLEEDSAAFCWNQMVLYAYPGAIIVCVAVFICIMVWNECHILFILAIVLLASLPIIRTSFIGKRQTKLKKQVSEYNEQRKQMEQELYDAREFAKSFALEKYFVDRLKSLFHAFFGKTGMAQCRMDARTEVLDFFCEYGVQLGTILVGTLLMARGKLTLGSLLAGYLMIPTIQQGERYVREWIIEKHDEKKYLERLAFFYTANSEAREEGTLLLSLGVKDVSFTYPNEEKPVLAGISFCMTNQENYRLMGENGSGKTTLLSILAGLYEPQAGIICNGATMASRRNSVAIQEQNGTIFSGSIWENLFLSEAKRAAAEGLLQKMGMEKTLDYEVASEGANLSPGEKKKILLVRALLKDASFLLLDEPFNHLDELGKRVLLSELERRKKGILLISHQEINSFRLKLKDYEMQKVI